MTYSWTVKYKGKLLLLLFSYIGAMLMIMELIPPKHFFLAVLISFPITLSILITPIQQLWKKKVPRRIELNTVTQTIKVWVTKKVWREMDLTNVAYEQIETLYFSVLILNTRITASRGHIVYHPFVHIIGTDFPISWNKKHLDEIAFRLKELGVERHYPAKPKHIIDHFFG